MATIEKTTITVKVTIKASVEKVWNTWSDPAHIIHWNAASDDWHTPNAENDLRVGGRFLWRMEARDGSVGFDFLGEYTKIDQHKLIEYTLDDGRKVQIVFASKGSETIVTEAFEAEQINPVDMQQAGWQAILNSFKTYVETLGRFEPLHFEVSIDANAEKVYATMLDEKQYSAWTAEFNSDSRFKGSWEKGSKILFFGEDQNGNVGGMVSRIKENIANKFVSIEHLGVIHNGKEITSGPEVDVWAGAMENYTFTEANGKTLLSIDADSNHEFKSYFLETWPKALQKLKAICEK